MVSTLYPTEENCILSPSLSLSWYLPAVSDFTIALLFTLKTLTPERVESDSASNILPEKERCAQAEMVLNHINPINSKSLRCGIAKYTPGNTRFGQMAFEIYVKHEGKNSIRFYFELVS